MALLAVLAAPPVGAQPEAVSAVPLAPPRASAPAQRATTDARDPVAAWRHAWPSAPLRADLADRPGNGPLRLASVTPASQAAVLRRDPHPPQTVAAWLSLPPGQPDQSDSSSELTATPSPTRWPAVVLMHGSGGVYSALLHFWPQRLNQAGFATLVVDSFGPRGVRSTAEDQSLVPREADLADAFAALRLLSSDPRIDPHRIAIMGFSRGGATTWRVGVQALAQALAPDGERFAAHVPVYSGGCSGLRSLEPRPGLWGTAPMLWVHGGADDYAPAQACQDFSARIAAAGTPVRWLLIPGAHHKFDADREGLVRVPRVQATQSGCPLAWDLSQQSALDRRTGQLLPAATARALHRSQCQKTGASLQGDHAARETAAQAVIDFLRQTLQAGTPAQDGAPRTPSPSR